MKPADYFSTVIQGMMHPDGETEGAKSGSTPRKKGVKNSAALHQIRVESVPFEYQAAAISNLVTATGQLSHSLIPN
jgi:hypothetical protein